MQRARDQTLVVALGNPLVGEDAVGAHVYDSLRDGAEARVVFLGTDVFRLSNVYRGEERLVVVDAVYAPDLEPGRVVHFQGAEVFERLRDVAVDAHLLGVGEGLKILRLTMPRFPSDVHFVGVSVKTFGHGQMSPEVARGAEKAVALVQSLLQS
ncbi:MAG: hydrogenase maturation protease [Thermoplasmatota archaeon]